MAIKLPININQLSTSMYYQTDIHEFIIRDKLNYVNNIKGQPCIKNFHADNSVLCRLPDWKKMEKFVKCKFNLISLSICKWISNNLIFFLFRDVKAMRETVRAIKIPCSKEEGRGEGICTLSSVNLKTKHAKSFWLIFFYLDIWWFFILFPLAFYLSVK